MLDYVAYGLFKKLRLDCHYIHKLSKDWTHLLMLKGFIILTIFYMVAQYRKHLNFELIELYGKKN